MKCDIFKGTTQQLEERGVFLGDSKEMTAFQGGIDQRAAGTSVV